MAKLGHEVTIIENGRMIRLTNRNIEMNKMEGSVHSHSMDDRGME